MKSLTYEKQNQWIEDYLAPIFIDLNIGQVVNNYRRNKEIARWAPITAEVEALIAEAQEKRERLEKAKELQEGLAQTIIPKLNDDLYWPNFVLGSYGEFVSLDKKELLFLEQPDLG